MTGRDTSAPRPAKRSSASWITVVFVDPGSGVAPATTSKYSMNPRCSNWASAIGACFDVAVARATPALLSAAKRPSIPSKGRGSRKQWE